MTIQRSNLLFLVHRLPYPPNRGDRIRSFHMLKFLSQHYHVYLATLYDEEPDPSELEVLKGLCRQVAAFPIGKYSRWVKASYRIATGRSATEGLFESTTMRERVRDWMKSIPFDVAIAFCSSMAQYVDPSSEIPLVVDLVDVDSQKWFDYAEHAQGWKRILFQLEGRRLRRLECSLPERCRAVTLVSDAEAQVFRDVCPNRNTYSVGNGVDLEYYHPNADLRRQADPCRLVFVGALDYRANSQCLDWFCKNCWPTIHRNNPRATLALVGRNPSASVRRLGEMPGVQLVGQVPDVRPFVWSATIAIAPLRIARGIQNKVLEAMAMGIPVVASPQAIEGIGCRIGEHLLAADTPVSWIRTIESLLDDRARQESLGIAARAFVELRHSWTATLETLLPLLQNSSQTVVKNKENLRSSRQLRSQERIGVKSR